MDSVHKVYFKTKLINRLVDILDIEDQIKMANLFGLFLLAFGSFFFLFGIIFWFDRYMITCGNLIILSGIVFIYGFRQTIQLFFGIKKIKAS